MGKIILGIEFGSTRIKGVLLEKNKVIFSNNYEWENHLENGYWSYSQNEILKGLKECYKGLKAKYELERNEKLVSLNAIGISAMMHGFIALDKDDNFLTPFRTWRNTKQSKASEELSNLFDFNIPERWSIAHFYQAILNKEEYINKIKYITTLSGYIHYLLTGEKVLGINDASGMFPISPKTKNYNNDYVLKFNKELQNKGIGFDILEILPKPLLAGEIAGKLTKKGISLIDESCELEEGIPFCPPEGDAGTGMIATNSIKEGTGNISAGTSIFTMLVLNKQISKRYKEIDIVCTPDAKEVAMVHCNNCSSELDSWVNFIKDSCKIFNKDISYDELYSTLYSLALKADKDCGKIYSCNYLSGEHITGLDSGVPLIVRQANGKMSVPNFFRGLLNSALCTMRIGMEILEKEDISIEKVYGHGGLFKVKDVGQKIVSCALNAPITITNNAGEGGAFGIAVLASYLEYKNKYTLSDYLNKKIYNDTKEYTVSATKEEKENFDNFLDNYKKLLEVERVAQKLF